MVLRDAGREAEATPAINDRNARAKSDASAAAEAERSVAKGMEQMRDARQAQRRRRVCP